MNNMLDINVLFFALILFQLKHLLCDYVFQGPYCLGKFSKTDWFCPLFSHCSAHAAGTLIALVILIPDINAYDLVMLALLDLVAHFIIDRGKVLLSRNTNHEKKSFWVHLGLDQGLHHLTHYIIIFIALTHI